MFENIVRKGEIASNKQFLHFPQCFLLNQIIVSPFVHIFDIISLVAFELEESKIGISRKGLTFCQNATDFNEYLLMAHKYSFFRRLSKTVPL